MATIGEDYVTMSDLAKRLDPNREGIAPIIELLEQSNPILNDIPMVQCNMTAAHRVTHRVSMPQAYWRSINKGTDVSKSETSQYDEPTGQLVARAQVDRTLIELNGNSKTWLLSEERAFVEAMNQEMARTLIYGDQATDTDKFTGLEVRYNTLNPAKSGTAKQVIDAGGTGDNGGLSSGYLVHWDPRAVHGLYPGGIPGGIRREVQENADLTDRDGREFKGFKSRWEWNFGLAVEDPRFVVRLANIDIAGLDDMIENGAASPASQKLIRLMLKAHSLIPNAGTGRSVWYVPRSVGLMMDIIASEKANVNLTTQTVEGGPGSSPDNGPKRTVTTFRGTPVKYLDVLRTDELRVTAA